MRLYAIAFLLRNAEGAECIRAIIDSASDGEALVAAWQERWRKAGYQVVAYDVAEAPRYILVLIANDWTGPGQSSAKTIPIKRVD